MTCFALLAQADATNPAPGADVFAGLLAFGALFWVVALAAMAFWVWMLVDVLTSRKAADEKILWFLVVFFLHLIGAVIYFVAGRSPRTRAVGVT